MFKKFVSKIKFFSKIIVIVGQVLHKACEAAERLFDEIAEQNLNSFTFA